MKSNSAHTPQISVIVPAYNAANTLNETLESIAKQTFQDFEVVVVDDGSTDHTAHIVHEWHKKDPRFWLMPQPNRGLAGARNTGIRHAKSPFVALLDADDRWLPHKLEKHLAHLKKRPKVGISFCPSAFIDVEGKSLGYTMKPPLKGISAATVLLKNPIGCGSSAVIRKAALEDIAFSDPTHGESAYFDEAFRQSEDIECWVRFSLTTKWEIEGIPEALTEYRLHNSGLSSSIEKQKTSWEAMLLKTAGYAPHFIRTHAKLARAFQWRYLSRRAVWMRKPHFALQMFITSIKTAPTLAIYSPIRTTVTLGCILAQFILPDHWYNKLERFLMQRGTKYGLR